MKNTIIIVSSIMACLILYLLEQVFSVNYATKTVAKLIIFTLIPIIFIYIIDKKTIKAALNLRSIHFKQLLTGIILGLLSFLVIIVSYLLFKNFINLDQIKDELTTKSNITKMSFIYVGLYIIFVNSFLEEFFFRGFIFLNMYEKFNKKFAYLFSAILFAVYHIAIFKTWFNIYLILLALIGLVVIGVIFNYLDTLSKNFINSYIVHMLADMAIILIGLRMFGIL